MVMLILMVMITDVIRHLMAAIRVKAELPEVHALTAKVRLFKEQVVEEFC